MVFYIGLTVTFFMSEQTENEEQIQQIKNSKGENFNFTELHINRVPDQEVDQLKNISYEMFAGDYGATLAYLLELHELRQEFDQKLVNTNRKVVELEDKLDKVVAAMSEDDTTTESNKKEDTLQ